MPPVSLLLPAALLVATAIGCGVMELLRVKPRRLPAAAAAWLALAGIGAVWLAARNPLEISGPVLGAGVRADFRLDALAVVCVGMVMVPGAALLSLQRRGWGESGTALAALAAACLAIQAAGVPLTALALGAAGVLVMLPLRAHAPEGDPEIFSIWMAVSWVALLCAGAGLQAVVGTGAYAAIPVAAFGMPVFILLAGAALLVAGMTPWSSWLVEAARRSERPAAAMSLATLPPAGFYLLLRAYDVGDGRYPSRWLNAAMVLLGLMVALAAGLRGLRASNRTGLHAELLAVNYGLAVFAIGLGSPLGGSAAVILLLGASLLVALAPLMASAGPMATLLGLMVVTALPPSLLFGGRLLAVEAGLESGEVGGLAALVAAGAWVLSLAAAARGLRLPELPSEAGPGIAAPLICTALFLAGAGLGLVQAGLALPAAAEVLGPSATPPAGGLFGVSSLSGSWQSFGFGVPMLVIGATLLLLSRGSVRAVQKPAEAPPGPSELLTPAWLGAGRPLLSRLRALSVPEEYRSLLDLRAVDATLAAGSPALWLLVVAALAYAMTR